MTTLQKQNYTVSKTHVYPLLVEDVKKILLAAADSVRGPYFAVCKKTFPDNSTVFQPLNKGGSCATNTVKYGPRNKNSDEKHSTDGSSVL